MHGNSKNDRFLEKKVKLLHKHCPAAIGTTFSAKFVLDPKVKNIAF